MSLGFAPSALVLALFYQFNILTHKKSLMWLIVAFNEFTSTNEMNLKAYHERHFSRFSQKKMLFLCRSARASKQKARTRRGGGGWWQTLANVTTKWNRNCLNIISLLSLACSSLKKVHEPAVRDGFMSRAPHRSNKVLRYQAGKKLGKSCKICLKFKLTRNILLP